MHHFIFSVKWRAKPVFALFALLLSSNAAVAVTDPILQPVTHVSTDAVANMYCDLSLGLGATNEILGLDYECQGAQRIHNYYPLAAIKKGVVLFHYDAFNADIIAISGPNLDAVQGGPVRVRYLSNLLSGEYKNWDATFEPQGLKWVAYTSTSDGHRAFNDIFAVKRTVFGQPVGIQEIRATWK